MGPRTPIEETLEALHDVVKAGKVRYIGASSMWAWQFATRGRFAEQHGWTRFVSMQNHYNLLYREEEREMMTAVRAEGIGVIPWSPLARGRLARPWENYSRSVPKPTRPGASAKTQQADKKVVDRVAEVANARGIPRAQIALAWVLSKPVVTAPIVGATKLHHLDDASGAADGQALRRRDDRFEEPYVLRHPCRLLHEHGSHSEMAGPALDDAIGSISTQASPAQRRLIPVCLEGLSVKHLSQADGILMLRRARNEQSPKQVMIFELWHNGSSSVWNTCARQGHWGQTYKVLDCLTFPEDEGIGSRRM